MSDLPEAAPNEIEPPSGPQSGPPADPPVDPQSQLRAEAADAGAITELTDAPAAEQPADTEAAEDAAPPPVRAPEPALAPQGIGDRQARAEAVEAAPSNGADADTVPPAPAPLHVDHVPHVVHVYSSEELEFVTRVCALEAVRGFTLDVSFPPGTEVVDADQPRGVEAPGFIVGTDELLLRWQVADSLEAGAELLFGATVVVPENLVLGPDPLGVSRHSAFISRARALPLERGRTRAAAALEWAAVEVRARARYLSYLPSVFERDTLMSRFLMAFESFWSPLEQQVNSIDSYFDPGVMSLPMLHWLADRMDLEIDEEWDEDVQRRMMRNAVRLFRKRGTRDGLQELLEVYTGGEATIVERRAENFKIGKETRLGSAVALGAANQPHTFSVLLKAPPVRTQRPEQAQQLRDLRRQRVARLIDTERPAHVRYTLEIVET